MKILLCFGIDLVEGFRSIRLWLGVFAVLMASMVAALLISGSAWGHPFEDFSLGDYLVSFVAGNVECQFFAPGDPFVLPAAHFTVFLCAAYMTLWYPHRDMGGFGLQLFVVGGSRWSWWIAKCLWVVAVVACACLIAFSTALLATFVLGGDFVLDVSSDLPQILDFPGMTSLAEANALVAFFASVFAVTCSLCLVQLVLTVAAHPYVSCGASMAILLVSAFSASPWLPGSYLMAARSICFISHGFDPMVGFVGALIVCVAAVAAGGFALSRKDLLEKGE